MIASVPVVRFCGHCCSGAQPLHLLQTLLDGFNTGCHCLIFPDAMRYICLEDSVQEGSVHAPAGAHKNALWSSSQHDKVKGHFKQLLSFMELHLPAKRLLTKDITVAQSIAGELACRCA